MDGVKRNMAFLKGFEGLSDKQKVAVIGIVTKEQADVISDIAANVVAGVLKISDNDKTTLKNHKSFIRLIAAEEATSLERQKTIRDNPRPVIKILKATVHRLARISKQL